MESTKDRHKQFNYFLKFLHEKCPTGLTYDETNATKNKIDAMLKLKNSENTSFSVKFNVLEKSNWFFGNL